MTKRRFSSRLIDDGITMHDCRVLTSTECTTTMIAGLAVTDGLGSS
jgi:hypothetical protein